MSAYSSPEKTDYSKSLPTTYVERMTDVLEAYSSSWITQKMRDDGYAKFYLDCYIYGRLDQCRESIVPWLSGSIPNLADRTVLEIGSGTGSSTAGLAPFVQQITGFDIESKALEIARVRCEALGISNVDLHLRGDDWIDRFAENPLGFFQKRHDLVLCYALFEHLTIAERLKLLRTLWEYLPIGGLLVTIELPNRLHWFDWHSSHLPFADQLPPDLSALYYAQTSRGDLPAHLRAGSIEHMETIAPDRIYRYGKGMSYHEFDLALPRNSYRIIGGSRSPNAINRCSLPGYDAAWEQMLAEKLALCDPPVSPEFASCSLDLIIERTA